MRIRFYCSNPDCGRPMDLTVSGPRVAPPACPHCRRPGSVAVETLPDGPLTRCPCCGGEELFVRRDFPQRLGLLLVVAVAAASLYLFGRGRLEWALGVLVGLAAVDLIIYRLVPAMTVCYRCRAEFRGLPLNPRHAGFDLATAEKYRSGR